MIDLDEIARRGVRTTEELDALVALARAGRRLAENWQYSDDYGSHCVHCGATEGHEYREGRYEFFTTHAPDCALAAFREADA